MGVYVFPDGAPGTEALSKKRKTIGQVAADIRNTVASKVLVEAFIARGSSVPDDLPQPPNANGLPDEYKFHMFNGKIGSINKFSKKCTDCACFGEVDENWNRVDTYGCFYPTMPFAKQNSPPDQCYKIDFAQGATDPYPFKGHDLCGVLPAPSDCVLERMKAIAVDLSSKIGVYVRIDFFVTEEGRIYVQEFSLNHSGGLRQCASRVSADGCIDSCFMGRYWKENGGNPAYGGPLTSRPTSLASWSTDTCPNVDAEPAVSETCV